MIFHPLPLAIFVLDALGLAMVLAAAFTAIQVVLEWRPGAADNRQIRLETGCEIAAFRARFGFFSLALGTLVWVIGITGVLPPLVPGAMCGTGVLQAMDGRGHRVLTFRLITIAILYIWYALDRLDRSQPDAPLAVQNARFLLLAVPFLLIGLVDTFRAIVGLDLHEPVNCCAVVYDQLRSSNTVGKTSGIPDIMWVWGAGLGSIALMALSGITWVGAKNRAPIWSGLLGLTTLLWAPAAAVAMTNSLSAYHYEVLHHQCPWCLFLPEHRMVGYPIFGALLLTAAEGTIAAAVAIAATGHSELAAPAGRRIRSASQRVIIGVTVYGCLAWIPPILWRLRYGVWMG